ncbi:MAG: selenide, water dikinase SelD [Pseudomonadales bacterium]
MQQIPNVRDIVLVGGGHSHVQVLRRFGMRPVPGVRLTLVVREPHTPYSGMLPGFIAGQYSWDDIHIDLARLGAFCDARFIAEEVIGVDPTDRRILFNDRPSIRYDALSINIGGVPLKGMPVHDTVLPVKPIGRFIEAWESLLERTRDHRGFQLAIVGGGPGSVELAIAIAERFGPRFCITLITADSMLLRGHSNKTRATIGRILGLHGIVTTTGFTVNNVDDAGLWSAAGDFLVAESTLWVTGVEAPKWLRESGFDVDGNGFIRVDRTLRSTSYRNVFAAGDVVELVDQPRPKSGVFAVREGPVLAENLQRFVVSKPLRQYRAQRRALALIRVSHHSAIASRGAWSMHGRWMGAWKQWIDGRFMRRFNQLPFMTVAEPELAPSLRDDAPAAMRCGGCGAKLGADLLARVLSQLPLHADPDVRQGIGDDAAIVELGSSSIVTSCDSFRAMISDPYRFGRIAAHHAMNDLFAMGAVPRIALAIATVPVMADAMMEDDLLQMMTGAVDVFSSHGVRLVGGHSAEASELSIGFTVTGAAPNEPFLKSGMQVGDQLVLSKPIGTGVLLAGAMQGKTAARDLMTSIEMMDQSNALAAGILRDHGTTACTDVTGFGLLGHLGEMMRASDRTVVLDAFAVPVLAGACVLMERGVESSLQRNNEQAVNDFVVPETHVHTPLVRMLADPQTAGGLLASVPRGRSASCIVALAQQGYEQAHVVGMVTDEPTSRIRVS